MTWQRPIWRKRGTGWPIKYGPAHAADMSRVALTGWYAYCGVWFPQGRDHQWDNASADDRKCRICERGAQRDAENPPPRRHPDTPRPNIY